MQVYYFNGVGGGTKGEGEGLGNLGMEHRELCGKINSAKANVAVKNLQLTPFPEQICPLGAVAH